MPRDLKVLEAQKIVKAAGFDPGPIDGIPGKRTKNAIREYLNVHTPDGEIFVLDVFRHHWKYWPEASSITGTVITLKPVRMMRYTGKMATLWIASDVYYSFVDALKNWEEIKDFRMTETLRMLKTQISLKKRKPSLAAKPGWSLHGHGRAFDFDIRSVSSLIKFYRHMGKYGWYNIYSKLNPTTKKIDIVPCPRNREAWHLQRTDPPGVHKNTYLRKWAETRGGLDSLIRVSYKYDRSDDPVIINS